MKVVFDEKEFYRLLSPSMSSPLVESRFACEDRFLHALHVRQDVCVSELPL